MKSHFQFSRKERSGIFLLILLILTAQLAYMFLSRQKGEIQNDNQELDTLRSELDSLRLVETKNNQPKIYPFNPNFITDYKGYTLGLTNEEIDRLHKFRAENNWVNSKTEFQQVTKVSDSVLASISPYFKFPDWITNSRSKSKTSKSAFTNSDQPQTFDQKIDLNKATSVQLQKVYGIGKKLSERILTYREKFEGGFASDVELIEIYGLKPEVIANIKNRFTVKTPRVITKLNLNEATRDQLVTIPYIDYEVAKNIIEERSLREGFNSLEELTKVEDLPVHKIDIIKLYLQI